MSGIFYAVGVGSGDPELLTLKAVRIIQENELIAVAADTDPATALAYRIAVQAVPELAEKTILPVSMPMIHDRQKLCEHHQNAARSLEKHLIQGENVVFLTLGDPTIYSTAAYLQQIIAADGYPTQFISGIPSFCAAAARVGMPLVEWQQPLHIIPAVHHQETALPDSGCCVFMKSGRHLQSLQTQLEQTDRQAVLVENCGLEQEKIYTRIEDFPEQTGYYTLIISREHP